MASVPHRCWAVLEIVPQMSVQRVMEEGVVNTTSGVVSESSPTAYTMVYSNISLEESEKAGEIATIPLTKIISLKYRHYSWVAELIQIFIAISITVSFLVMGSAMKHTIDGLVNSHWNTKLEWMSKVWERTLPQSFHRCSSRGLANGLISLLAFGIIFIVSSCDPRGFVVMLDKVVSFSLNTEVGLFIFVMLRASRSERFQHLTVPLPVGQRVFQLHWTLPIYFMFAVAYDVIQSIVEIAEHNIQHSSQPLLTNYSLS